MQLKTGVRIFGVRPELVLALTIIERVYQTQGSELVITSVTDGEHMRGSLHYTGAAVDLRLPVTDVDTIVVHLKADLGQDFDVVLEPDHIHVEFQPKTSY